ncbi:MAG: family 43 glycosylhydrolase, partial [Planctomycetes bacterium]|nr:family 43 glycosylhydrolase [Planctomycetota bacterium]
VDGKAFVQMAISYRGNEVTIYRNAKRYARYKITSPQSFKSGCKVLIGLRYIGGQGEVGFLAGAIDDVRIYASALTGEHLAALKPNGDAGHKSIKPVAWWTFKDGSTAYGNKMFGETKLVGNAKIADGRLILDGKNSYLIASKPPPAFRPEIQSMFYKARHPDTGNMWDTWLYLHDGTYYLYYLANKGRGWNNISMARSKDGVHWLEVGQVLYKGPGVTWMGTGSTWKSPNYKTDGRFFMNFSEWKGPRQTIFFAESTDLLRWKRLGGEFEFKQDERWYQPRGRWDCIWTIARPGGGLYGYWTATPKPETGGRFGFGETLDGIHWKALKAPEVTGVGGGEVGAIEKIGGKYYMMFGN